MTTTPAIHPTFRCFDDALDFISERVMEQSTMDTAGPTLLLVHAICLAPGDGEPYAHAWVEEANICWDAGILRDGSQFDGQRVYYSVERTEFYAARRVQETTKYTVREALKENFRTNHYGPWKEEYRALCVRGEKRVFGPV